MSTVEHAAGSAGVVGEVERDASEEPIRCGYCDRCFAEDDLLALHRGHSHPEELTGHERERFEAAYAGEEEGLRLFRLKALLALMALYFMLLFAYSVFG